jgi:hypothetical protein
MNYIVQHLLEEIDSKTQALLPLNGNLVLLGDLESQFLKSVRKKAERFGINCIGRIENPAGIVVDIETAKIDREFMEGFNRSPFNIDGPLLNGMTSVSQAAYMILDDQGLIRGKNVTIVGRGNAVTGLAEMLIKNDATVTVAHSKTKDVFGAIDGCDVAVYATPSISIHEKPHVNDMVIDVGGVWSSDRYTECQYIDRIGPLTISVLLNRLARVNVK